MHFKSLPCQNNGHYLGLNLIEYHHYVFGEYIIIEMRKKVFSTTNLVLGLLMHKTKHKVGIACTVSHNNTVVYSLKLIL